jgi:glycine betaine/proline transport system permease protein
MTAISLPALRRRETSLPRWAWAALLFGGAAIAFVIFAGEPVQPRTESHPLFTFFVDVRDFIRDNRDNVVYQILFQVPRTVVDVSLETLTDALHAIGWPGLIAVMGTLGFLAGGWRLALGVVLGFVGLGLLGLWESSVDTLGAIIAAVGIAFTLGVPLGILMAQSRRFRAVLTPILDVMQILPTFAYLLPLVLLFGIGPATAAIVTLIYAMPAAIRITALGIRNVPVNTVEAGTSLGTTPRQLLLKVRLPLARRELGLALNQTLMLAVSMIVITALIDAPGLGADTLSALIRNDVGRMLDAGIAIVILAIVLDRVSERASSRLDPHQRARTAATTPDRRTLGAVLAGCAVLVLVGLLAPFAEEFPEVVSVSVREPVNALVDWLRSDLAWLTIGLKDALTFAIINPVEQVFTTVPVWIAVGVAAGIALLVSGTRQAVTAGACLVAIFLMGLWQDSMITLVQVLAATAITFGVGLVLGIASARSDRFQAAIRPLLDIAQTMPAFVYLLPAFVLFEATRFTAIFAAVIFALPPVIRLVDVGIRAVPATIIEASTSSGVTGSQLLTKVQLPVARGALQLALNQAVILVLSMVVVGGLVGGGALGYNVVAGFAQSRLFGMGVASGLALVLLGIMLDRMTQGPTRAAARH